MTARRGWRVAAALAGLLLAPAPAAAHEMKPALLELRAVGDTTLATLTWSLPNPDARPRLVLPDGCPPEVVGEGPTQLTQRVACPLDTLVAEARLDLNAYTPDAVVRAHQDGDSRAAAVGRDSTDLGLCDDGEASTPGFVWLGIEHILGGLDHLLFVLGLLLIVFPAAADRRAGMRRLGLAVTAFTVSHSITLGLSVLDLVRLPMAGVEAAIAASLVLLGIEAYHQRDTWTRRSPAAVAFAFGLLHGFGFAGALREIGLPDRGIARALLSFNIGVELGQLAFVVVVLVAFQALHRLLPARWWLRAGTYAVGGLGSFWVLKRTYAIMIGGSG